MHDVSKDQVGQALRRLRGGRGWTLDELSEECGFSRSQLSRWERAERTVSAVSLAKILSALGASHSDYDLMLSRVCEEI